MMDFADILTEKGRKAGLCFNSEQLAQFTKYYELLLRGNEVMNLTAITAPEEVAVKHMIDSLMTYNDTIFPGKCLADVGTGAGFPGVPLKIYCPTLRVTLMDSLSKRVNFLTHVINELHLENITCVHLRAEDAGRSPNHREVYDLVTARAVARLNVLAEYCLPLVKPGGFFMALKGSKFVEEIDEAKEALKVLGGRLLETKPIKLPDIDDGRAIIIVKKIKAVPGMYPRRAGIPEKQPLGGKEQ
ncbi:MAG: 16S rRNA (guanine(527)-N(7))-methyltransferase RsmG [Phascolarctobacterium sp.]|nr:16S rRNA (guanine(527)-N(7))-methyltransferase RsmG [Phascolarctobacterium sp.]